MKNIKYKKVLREHKNRIFGYAFYFLRNREDAEDVTQDVFLKVWQNWDKIDQSRMVAWMMRVTYNQCIDLSRRKKTSGNNRRTSADYDLAALPSEPNSRVDPEWSYDFSETQKMLLSALQTLPRKTQSMLLLHYFQGLKYETIGEMLDTKVATIKVAIHRGRKMLRQVLADDFPEKVRKCQNECAMS